MSSSLCIAELCINDRVDLARTADIERQPCCDGAASEAAPDKVAEAVNHNGSIDVDTSQHSIESLQRKADRPHVSAASTYAPPLSPGSSSMRHSASDSDVYRADIELASSREVLAVCLHADPVTTATGLNGYCKAVADSQVCKYILLFTF